MAELDPRIQDIENIFALHRYKSRETLPGLFEEE